MSGLAPKLRFPEFKDDWRRTTLGKESTCLDNKRIPIKEGDRAKMVGTYPYYGASGIIDYIDQYIFDEPLVLLAEDGANIINRSTPIAFIASGKYWVNNHAHVYKAKGSTLFLATYLENLRYDNYNTGTAQPKLNGAVCNNLPLNFPSLPEQQKIADFLSSIDAKIDAVKRKLNAFERYKKSLMQQIFAQKIRFKQDDGSDFPEWEEKRLGDVAAVNSGLAIDQNERKSGYKVTRIETISDGSINLSKIGYVDTNNDISNYLLNEGDILFSNINSVKHIGKIALINNERELYHGMNLLRIIPSNKINSLFLYSYLKTTPLKRHFERVCNQAVSQASINQTELKKTKIVFPSLPEQQKIADFLSSVDAKIDAIKRQIEKLEAFKKGLLQQMFV